MIFIFYIFILLLGLSIGSFLNCVIYRLTLPNFSFWKNLGGLNRSYCVNCKHILTWQDLMPVFSFLFLEGKCRYCHKKISIQYPLVELATGLIFLLIFNFSRFYRRSPMDMPSGQLLIFNQFSTINFINLIFLFYVASALIVIFVYDLRHYIIPDKVLFPAIAITFLYQLIFLNLHFFNHLLSAFGAFLFFWLIFFISKEKWMGFGDCKLVILLGLLLGYPQIFLGIFSAFFLGAIIGGVAMLLNKKGLKSEIPFAPFLITGTFVAMFFGDKIIRWYLHFLIPN